MKTGGKMDNAKFAVSSFPPIFMSTLLNLTNNYYNQELNEERYPDISEKEGFHHQVLSISSGDKHGVH